MLLKVTATDEWENFCLKRFFLTMRNATCSPDVTIVTKTFWWSMVIQIKSIGSIATITRLTTMLKTVLMHDAPKKIVAHAKTIQMQNLHQQ